MKKFSITFILLLALASCAAPGTKFSDMTPVELMAYNRTVEYLDQVYCQKRIGTGSHIRRQECTSYRDLAEGRVGSLDTPSSSYSITYGDWR